MRTIHKVSGYRKDGYCYFTAEGFGEACEGHDPNDVARMLDQAGLLGEREQGRWTMRLTVPGMSKRVRVLLYDKRFLSMTGMIRQLPHLRHEGRWITGPALDGC